MKILSLFGVIFPLLDPDPTAQINADPCGSGSGSEMGRGSLFYAVLFLNTFLPLLVSFGKIFPR
jgi:hypothetical protein